MTAFTTADVEAALVRLDGRIAGDPGAYALEIDRGQFLELLGRKDEAVQSYVRVLRREPTNPAALNALGLLTLAIGNREGARTLLAGAVLHGPDDAAAHANLAYLHLQDGRLDAARTLYDRALALDPTLAAGHHGLAELFERQGDADAARRHRALGLRHRPLTLGRYRGTGTPVRLLVLGSAAFGNVPAAAYLDDRVFSVASLVVEYDRAEAPLPPHDLIFNLVGEADLCGAALEAAARIAARSGAPVINAPAAILATSRAANAARLRTLPGVVTAAIVRLTRAELAAPDAVARLAEYGLGFPLLVRSPGFHTGEHFVKVPDARSLPAAVASLPGDDLYAMEFIDVRDAAGDACKYRAIIVDGALYPLHLAISRDWKVHYFSADMERRADHRARDAAFLEDMAGTLGPHVMRALERARDMLALDFGGIDFAIDTAGNAVIFEANASMVVPEPDGAAIWDYRRGAVARIHAAVREMLQRRARVSAPHGAAPRSQ